MIAARRLPDRERNRSTLAAEEMVLLAQMGRTLTTLALGYVVAAFVCHAETAIATTALPAGLLAGGAAFLVAAGHVVLGEQIPRLVGAQHAERIAAWVVKPAFMLLVLPARVLARPIVGLGHAIARLMRLQPGGAGAAFAHTPEEIQRLVAQSHAQGVVEEDEQEMIRSVFRISTTVAREVMTPRTDLVAVSVDASLDELLAIALGEEHSRLPVYDGSLDTIVGVVLVKDLLPILASAERRAAFTVRSVLREPFFVPDTKPVDDILAEFRASNVHMAIVLDEFGGTYGIVTLEDVLEEIVGEIHDEHDVAEPDFTATPEGDVLIDGGALIFEVNARFGFALPEADFDTIGGYTFGALGRVPVAGDEVPLRGQEEVWRLRVEHVEDRRITRLRLIRGGAGEPVALIAEA
jgi:putative hemolysin